LGGDIPVGCTFIQVRFVERLTDHQGPCDAVSGDPRLDRGISGRQQGHDGVDGRTKHAHRTGAIIG